MSKQKMIFLIVAMGLLLFGYNFRDNFPKLTPSKVEEGTKEALTQSKLIEAKQQKINQKKQQFPEFIQLLNVNDTNTFVSFAFRKKIGEITQIDVEANMPSPGIEIYEVWLRGTNPKNMLRLGAMTFNQTDDYSSTYETEEKISDYNTILISRESVSDDKLETIIMTGGFPKTDL